MSRMYARSGKAAGFEFLSPLPRIEKHIERCLKARSSREPAALAGAIRYATLAGGKRLRPLLAWHCCSAVGGNPARSLLPGVAIELVHAFSLVHDDLPALDNDDLRRGLPTLHKHAGEAMAILAGDAMLAGAFNMLALAPWLGGGGENDLILRYALIRELSIATTAMIHGQVYDTLASPPRGMSPLNRLRLIHRNKTGALILAACRMGAMSGTTGRALQANKMRAIHEYGRAVGLLFQVVDDLLDVEQSTEQTGKRTGKDAHAGKLTYPGLLGVEGSRAEARRLLKKATRAIEPLGQPGLPLADIAKFIFERTH